MSSIDCAHEPNGDELHIADAPEPFILGDPGRAYWETGGGAPFRTEMPSDSQCDRYDFSGIAIRAASVRGISHRASSDVRQDHYSVIHEAGRGLVAGAVADGVGSKAHSHIAAQVACRTVTESLLSNSEDDTDLPSAFLEAANSVKSVSSTSGLEMATTLLAFVLEVGEESNPVLKLATVGDTSAWRFSGAAGFRRLAGGKGGSQDATLASTATTALSSVSVDNLDVHQVEVQPGDAVFLCTDGVGDLLEAAHSKLGAYFADVWDEIPTALNFAAQISFGLRTYTDDRTGILIWNCR
ncbi:protein phosphatase 2C domain-containing protein [Dietzia maris]